MVEPLSATITAAGSALQGAGSYFGAKAQADATKKAAKLSSKEQKRKTLADLLNQAFSRSQDTSKDLRRSQNDLSGARAKALQEMAAGIRQSLVR